MYVTTVTKSIFILLLVVINYLNFGFAQPFETKILPIDGGIDQAFGISVSIDNEYAIVGSSVTWTDTGAVYIFKGRGANWIQQARLVASDGHFGNWFGNAVAISGNYAVIGALHDDGNEYSTGAAYLFRNEGDSWHEQIKLIADNPEPWGLFGGSVSIFNEYVIIGASGDDDVADQAGAAYIFKLDGVNWVRDTKLFANDGERLDWFGRGVSIAEEHAIVGAYGDDDNGSRSGSAYIFKRTETGWHQEAKLVASDGVEDARFGYSVAISNDFAVVGAHWDDDNGEESGSAYVFKREGNNWIEQAKLTPHDVAFRDNFGYRVSMSGNYVLVSAHYDDDNGENSGSVYLFEYDGSSWIEKHKVIASDGYVNDRFGFSVAISGENVIVGAALDDDNGEDSGSVYIYNDFLTNINSHTNIAETFSLQQNFPNPFNPSTTINFTLVKPSNVQLDIFASNGQYIRSILSNNMIAGKHRVVWDGTNLEGKQVSSGVYYYHLSVDKMAKTRKMILLR